MAELYFQANGENEKCVLAVSQGHGTKESAPLQ